MIFIPVYLQVVDGMSPTQSGLAMLPMVVGIFTTSIAAGQLMSRNGRYKIFPILGAAIVIVALVMLSQLTATSPYWFAGLSMYVLGAGLGFTMQVLITVVQNSVDRSDIGVATSSVTFFRQMGGSFGTALFGAILSSRLAVHIADAIEGRPGRRPPGRQRRRRRQQRAGDQGAARAGAQPDHRGVQRLAARRVPVRRTPRGGGARGGVLPQGEAARDPRRHAAGRREDAEAEVVVAH